MSSSAQTTGPPAGAAPLPEVPGVEVRHSWVQAGDVRLHVAEAGDPGAPPLLALHGWPQHWWCWRRALPELEREHRVICADLRGFGWSDAPDGAYAKQDLATDILALMDAMGLERVGLIGHDWGGWIGFLMGLRAPQRFDGFLALGIPTPWARRDLRLLAALPRFAYQPIVAAPSLGAWVQGNTSFLPRVFGLGTSHALEPDAIAEYRRSLSEPARALAASRLYRTFLTRELPELLRGRYARERFRVPTLLVSGAKDAAIRPALLRGAADQADDLRVEVLPGCGHFIAEERPDVVVDRARTLFAVQSGPGGAATR